MNTMESLPDNIDQVGEKQLYLSVLMLGKRCDCPSCGFDGNPERLEFIHSGEEAVYCGDCGERLSDDRLVDRRDRDDRLPLS